MYNKKGIGIMTSATQPISVDAQRASSASYNCVAKSGNTAPNMLRTTVVAASAEAAMKRYVSMR